ncbi:MAG: pyrroloquinoline quinone-dependent dehydrogenase [Myxococcales bacterium]|nr:pyrroloquinoline quinone-dependent dehydrogenase [Myxococcales bacterium]
MTVHRAARRRGAALFVALALCGCPAPEPLDVSGPVAGWPVYGGDAGGSRHSPLTQITPANVGRLEPAWVHHAGLPEAGGTLLPAVQTTPILVGDALTFCTPRDVVISVDAETGAERWRFDPELDTDGIYVLNCRGVSSWTDLTAPVGACRTRILLGTLDARLFALDAATGRPCPRFGTAGAIDLRAGIGDVQPGEYGVTSPPLVAGDLVVVGTMVLDNRRRDAPGGVVRAYDARTGALAWAWDPVPPNERKVRESGEYTRGTTNAWSILSFDPALGLVYVPTGNTSPDYYGGDRNGLDHYSSSVVALDASTGKPRWHFQTVHHDVWDYDVPSQPVLFDFPVAGGSVPALVQATKLGHLFVLDRATGEPLLPVHERPVPGAGVPGEALSPTQPFPEAPSLHPTRLGPEDAWGLTPWDRAACRRQIGELRSEGLFTPPSLEGSIQYPGMLGGSNWGSVSVDPDRGLLIANTSRAATKIRLIPREEFDARFPEGPPTFGFEPQEGTPYALERGPLLSPLGAPCSPPPWGVLSGVDLATGKILWERPLGTTRDLAPWPFWLALGTPNQGGPLTTASGVTFVGATTDHFLRAFDTATGEELWRGRLPTGGHATPMTYRLRPEGQQFVVIAAGGHALLGTPPGDALVAFALPAP